MRTVAPVLIGLTLLVGCSSLPPLDDAVLLNVSPASSSDISRYRRAQTEFNRNMFGGATVKDGMGNFVSFSPDQYDEYLAFKGAESGSFLYTDRWPTMKLSFESSRLLVRSGDQLPMVSPDICNEKSEVNWAGPPAFVMWRGRFLTSKVSPDIKLALEKEPAPQRYEVLFSYSYRGQAPTPKATGPLLPLPGDLCVRFVRSSKLTAPAQGRPLRVSKEVVNKAINPILASQPARSE